MKTEFFATRTLARTALNASLAYSARFVDFGSTSPKGERWAVVTEVETKVEEPVLPDHQLIDPAEITKVLNQPAAIIAESTCISAKGKPVQVLYRRSHMAIRLAKHLANAS